MKSVTQQCWYTHTCMYKRTKKSQPTLHDCIRSLYTKQAISSCSSAHLLSLYHQLPISAIYEYVILYTEQSMFLLLLVSTLNETISVVLFVIYISLNSFLDPYIWQSVGSCMDIHMCYTVSVLMTRTILYLEHQLVPICIFLLYIIMFLSKAILCVNLSF